MTREISKGADSMVNQKTNIFRSQALERYMNRHEKTVVPKLIAPRTFIYLWLILGLLFLGGIGVLFADIPIYARALAIVVKSTEHEPKDVRAVLLLSPDHLPQLEVNQNVFFRMNGVDQVVTEHISALEPRVLSAGDLRNRFALSGTVAAQVTEPAVIAFIPLGRLPSGMEASSYLGNSYEAQVEIGRRRLVSFLPLVGRYFEKRSHKVNAALHKNHENPANHVNPVKLPFGPRLEPSFLTGFTG